MALKKAESGAGYWRLAHARISYDARECSFTLNGFASEEKAREQIEGVPSNAPVTTRDFRVAGAEFDKFFHSEPEGRKKKNFQEQCYAAAVGSKTDEVFADAKEI